MKNEESVAIKEKKSVPAAFYVAPAGEPVSEAKATAENHLTKQTPPPATEIDSMALTGEYYSDPQQTSESDNFSLFMRDTREGEIITQVKDCYSRIEQAQTVWYEKSKFLCPEGCGSCCHDFEPDLLEAEALYLAFWLLENQPSVAQKVAEGQFPFENGKTCPFHDFSNPYHCTVYEGRPFICRLFGASSNHGKNGMPVWKPCKFYPQKNLSSFRIPLVHRQYTEPEIKEIFGTIPPVMSDMMEQAVNICVENKETHLLREILPDTVKRLLWLKELFLLKG